ncbi:hypothetical protein INR49_032326 [Caranx melampygus]|nr:hypothetical protein INR49_032326 [Caranx melampygus]
MEVRSEQQMSGLPTMPVSSQQQQQEQAAAGARSVSARKNLCTRPRLGVSCTDAGIVEVNVKQLQDAAVLIPADQLFIRENLTHQT